MLKYGKQLTTARIVLASKSPRRVEILRDKALLTNLRVVPSAFEENLDKALFETPADYVKEYARRKAIDVAEKETEADLIIGCDTVVVLDGAIMEKPGSTSEAIKMISSLSGRSHSVFSGVALLTKEGCVSLFHTETKVTFIELDIDDIEAYVETGEPMDKAGGYGIQGVGGCFVEGIQGCFYNVMGFPLNAFCSTFDNLVQTGKFDFCTPLAPK